LFVGQYVNLDFVAAAVMLTLLIVAAFFDANRAEVPDQLTVPYAYMGIVVSVLHERWVVALAAALMVASVLIDWRPKWLRELNRKLMSITEKPDKMSQDDDKQDISMAARFAKGDGRLMTSVLGMVATLFLFGSVIGVLSLTDMSAQIRYIAAVVLCAVSIFLLKRQSDSTNNDDHRVEVEPLSAFGGADIIIFAGLLGFYGAIPFVYVMAVTMVGIFIMALIVMLRKGKKGTARIPLLPGLLLMAPLRLFILVTYCPRVLQTFSWASGNLDTWMH